jgi:hypothetical protein
MSIDPTPDHTDPLSLSGGEIQELFKRLFPHGLNGVDVRTELTPEGWRNSPFLAAFHPSVDQVWHEAVMRHKNFESYGLRAEATRSEPLPLPTREEIASGWKDQPVDESDELCDLMGMCLWDIFSDNHRVFANDGRVAVLGSFRGSAAFIADMVSEESKTSVRDYMDYYMGSYHLYRRARLRPVYGLIFRRLKRAQCDWRYSFRRVHLISFDDSSADKEQVTNYSPSEAFEREAKKAEAEAESLRLAAELDDIDVEARAKARLETPPETVVAYNDVFGQWPTGWPP